MAKNWAICLGINYYTYLTPLNYAKQDAEAVSDFFAKTVKFERVFLFTDDSPSIPTDRQPIPTQPTYGHFRNFLRRQFDTPLLKPGDNLWFFFAGHGIRHADCDYLMFSDSDRGDVENTAIAVSYIIERLRRWNSDNVMLFLDACRDKPSRGGLEMGQDKYQGVITFYSCRPGEEAREIEALQHGSFTHALLEGLQLQGERNCATVARLSQYIRDRVPQLNQQYGEVPQFPYVNIEPETKLNLPILPRYLIPHPQDIITLKNEAYRAEILQNWEESRMLWIRVNIAAAGTDSEAIDAISRIDQRRMGIAYHNPPSPNPQPSPRSSSEMPSFKFPQISFPSVSISRRRVI